MLELLTPIKTKLIRHRTLSQKNRPEDEKPGVQLYIEQQWPTSFLNFFGPTLCAKLYERPKGKKASQPTLEGFAEQDDLVSMTPDAQSIGTLPWTHDMTGFTISIVRGAGFSPNHSVTLKDASLSRWRFGLKEGMVLARYMIEAGNTPDEAWQVFATLTSRHFEMTAKPPEAVQSDIEDRKAEIPPAPTRKPGAAERAAVEKVTGKSPVAYRDAATGSTWSGRGLQPAWLKAALARGKKLSDFAVAPVAHKQSKAEAKAAAEAAFKPGEKANLSSEAAWPFPKGDKPSEAPPQGVTIEQSQPGTRTARGRDKTAAALARGAAT